MGQFDTDGDKLGIVDGFELGWDEGSPEIEGCSEGWLEGNELGIEEGCPDIEGDIL